MDPDKIDYIFKYFGGLMTKEEALAWRHYVSEFKINHSETMTDEKKEAGRSFSLKKGYMSEDPNILALLEGGIAEFRHKAATRILRENPKTVVFNNCPKCEKLTRTPKAKQCRFCGYDWH